MQTRVSIQSPQRALIPRFSVVPMVHCCLLLEHHMLHRGINKTQVTLALFMLRYQEIRCLPSSPQAMDRAASLPARRICRFTKSWISGEFYTLLDTEASQGGFSPSIVLYHILITSAARPCPQFQRYIVYSWTLISLLALHFQHYSDGPHTSH